jgi:hypothetical protein
VGKPFHGFPWPEAAKARLQAHPFLRKWEAMLAFGKRSPTPATSSFMVEKTGEKIKSLFPSGSCEELKV